ncbi:hypothetical protein NKR23_g12252 [Pleurostoma richardsiae]|uniref:CCHC-type domain-containing protein n=1 Tax=Pleurostoma richardsiae TaxID=41990 RepID=A0AA38R0F6_9PEZI|nr:hypothetical protein NKR23_g12252 [Pleurostoma richardsiae]
MASQTPKGPSARLLTMKFMQRAVASTPSSPSTPQSEDVPSAKRRKVSGPPLKGAGDSPSQSPIFNQRVVQAALEEEERKRQAALDRQAAESGDTHWVLDIRKPVSNSDLAVKTPLNVVQVGFAQIDSIDASEEDLSREEAPKVSVPVVRKFNMKKAKRRRSEANDDSTSSDSDSDSSGSSDDDTTGSSSPDSAGNNGHKHKQAGDREGQRRTITAKGRKDAERAKAREFAEKRRQKSVKLNKLTSISSAGAQSSVNWLAKIQCHSCGKTGHKASDCPQKGKR